MRVGIDQPWHDQVPGQGKHFVEAARVRHIRHGAGAGDPSINNTDPAALEGRVPGIDRKNCSVTKKKRDHVPTAGKAVYNGR